MPSIVELPTETLSQILQFLGHMDLRTLVRLQRTCRIFRSIIQNILNNPQAVTTNPEINVMINRKFKGLFKSMDCLSRTEWRRAMGRLPDPELPFKRVPWARKPIRDRYLREEASWRSLSVTWGSLPITQLEVVKGFERRGGTTYEYLRAEIPPYGLTMGIYYDLLLSKECHYGDNTIDWELILGKRLDREMAMNYSHVTVRSQSEFMRLFIEAPQSAVLVVKGFQGCCPPRFIKRREGVWRPRPIAEKPPKCQVLQEASSTPDSVER